MVKMYVAVVLLISSGNICGLLGSVPFKKWQYKCKYLLNPQDCYIASDISHT